MKHPDYLADDLTPRQLGEWAQVWAMDPWGEERADMRMARQVWATLLPHSKKPLRERDYLLSFAKPPTPEEYKAKARRIFERQNAAIAARGK